MLFTKGVKKKLSKYDYLIVGSGLFGAVFAQQMTEDGKSCLIIEKRVTIWAEIFIVKK